VQENSMANDSRFNVDDPRFRGEREQPASQSVEWLPDAPVKRRSWVSTCLIGCLITFVVMLAIVAVLAFWISRNWRDWASTIGSDALKQGINSTELPEDEKADMELQVDRLAVELREGRLSGEQLGAIFEQLMESPLMTTLVASAIEGKYIANSGLDEAEKAEAQQTIRRFLRGAIDHKINQQGIDAAMVHVAVQRQGRDDWELKNRVTDAELRAFLTEAKKQADAAEIPEEPEEIDPSDEFKRIIDEALQAQ
jgi:hypothetical protein